MSMRVREVCVPQWGLAHVCRPWRRSDPPSLLYGPAVRRLAGGLGPRRPSAAHGGDEGVVGSGEPAQGGGLAGQRLIVPALGRALEDTGHLGQRVGPACGEFAEVGHRGGLLVSGEVAPSGVVPGGSGELAARGRSAADAKRSWFTVS